MASKISIMLRVAGGIEGGTNGEYRASWGFAA